MPAERLSMRKIRELLRLKYEHQFSNRKIALSCGIARATVSDYLNRVSRAQLSWPLPEELTDDNLEALIFAKTEPSSVSLRPLPDWKQIQQELKRKGVTLYLLWEEYKKTYPEGFSYTRFCQKYRDFSKTLEPWMRQHHIPGEKCFVDYAGMTIPIIDRSNGEIKEAQIFVAVLGASNYTFVEATLDQSLPNWINSHIHAFEFFNGVTELLVPDNLRSGVSKSHRYDPDANPTYYEMAKHYGAAILPARVRKPKDKAKAEVGVQGVERRILALLRDHQFFSLTELNEALASRLKAYNQRPFQKLEGSRESQFILLDKPILKPLPIQAYGIAEWRKVRVGMDYHIELNQHYYSVPYRYMRKKLEVRITSNTIECFYKHSMVACHARNEKPFAYTTVKEHMPESHRAYLEWTPEKINEWAAKVGIYVHLFIEKLMQEREHPQQGLRASLGILRLGKRYTDERLEKACERALTIGSLRYQSVESILKNKLENHPLPEFTSESHANVPIHPNIRGANYYHVTRSLS
jgi:transposase